MFVSTKSGLRLREKPSIESNSILTIPYNEPVIILVKDDKQDIIEGKQDYWYEVIYGNKRGWVFGYYLSDKQQSISQRFFNYKEALKCCYKLCEIGEINCKKKCAQGDQNCLLNCGDCGERCEGGHPYGLLEFGWLPSEEEIKSIMDGGFIDARDKIRLPPQECL